MEQHDPRHQMSQSDTSSHTSYNDAKAIDKESQLAAYDSSIETTGNTKVVMAILSEMWLVNLIAILGGTYCMTFLIPQDYVFHSIMIAR
jgi:hypothetical protein